MNFLTGTSNATYHSDTTHLSSSGLKLLLKDPAQFHKEYILGERVYRKSAAFDEGTLVHSLILEPHLVESQYAVYPGARRTGKEYERFAQTVGPGKLIVTAAQMERAKELAQACASNSDCGFLLSDGEAEHSMVSQFMGVQLKARADYIQQSHRIISDVKTTSKPTGCFAETIAEFDYDLSAALYAKIAADNAGTKELFKFYWIVLSKADKGVSVVPASPEDMRQGLAKVELALMIYKHCKETGIWKMPESTFISVPAPKKEVPMSNTFKTKKGNELPLMNLKGKPYLQVAHRFVMLNDDTNRFVIRTEFPVLSDEQTVCRAEVMICSEIGEVLRQASGTKRETKKDFSDHTEKAETGAIGRALAMLGYGTQFATQDMDEGERLADAPIALPKRPLKKEPTDMPAPKKAANVDEF
jgi:hypothetical protein